MDHTGQGRDLGGSCLAPTPVTLLPLPSAEEPPGLRKHIQTSEFSLVYVTLAGQLHSQSPDKGRMGQL